MNRRQETQLYENETGDVRHNSSSQLLYKAFYLFGFANVLLVSYMATDHGWENQKIDREIDRLTKLLNETRDQLSFPHRPCVSEEECELDKVIREAKKHFEECNTKLSALRVMKNLFSETSQMFDIWDSIPKPYIQLQWGNQSRVEGQFEYLRGWKLKSDNQCSNINPYLVYHNERIKIKVRGYYYVYSKVTFECPENITGDAQSHSHSVNLLERKEHTLMTSVYQLCRPGDEKKLKASYVGGIYLLNTRQCLSVDIQKPESTKLRNQFDGRDVFFGAYRI